MPAGRLTGDHFPRVPAYAWSWLQRSRPVLVEASRRLDGGPPAANFVDTLQERFERDPFTRDVLIGVIADVAFNGRIPRRRPPGASWDRGLTWWAATIAGTTPDDFEAAGAPAVEQSRLFGVEEPRRRPRATTGRRTSGSAGTQAAPATPASAVERAAVIAALRDLLRTASDDRVPAAAIRSLIAQLDGSADRA